MKKVIKISFVLLIVISLVAFIVMTDMESVIMQITNIGYNFIYILLVSAGAFLAGALAWKNCFSEAQIPLHRLLYTRTIGEMITLFNPTNIVAGEAFKHYALKSHISNNSELLDSILISRALMIISQVLLSVMCLTLWLISNVHFTINLKLVGIATATFILYAFFYRMLKSPFNRMLSKSHKLKKTLLQIRILWKRLILKVKDNRPRILVAFSWSIVHWLLGALEILIIINLLGVSIGFFSSLSMDMSVVVLKSLGGFIPGQIGIEELSNKMILDFLGFGVIGLWISVSLTRRAKQIFWIVLSLFLYYFTHLSIIKNSTNGNTICNT